MTTSYLESFSSFFFVLLFMVVFISFYAFVFSPSLFTSFNIPCPPPQPSDGLPFAIGKSENGCDIFSGRWIRDEESRPLYEESECPYILPQQTCLARGRPDKDYLYWKWQPNGCSVPSFNASLMLEALRGKRMMFAGDSLSRGHFHSMVCLLQKFIPDNAKSIKDVGQRAIFTAKEYNATVEFYWAPYLLESNADDPKKHSVPGMARRGSINVHGQQWRGVDILVLHTYMWWFVDDYFKILEGSFQDEVKHTIDMPSDDAYRIGLESMLKWVEENMDPTKTRVFFTSASPNHKRNELWGGDRKGNCYNETILVEDPNYDVPKWLNKKIRIIDEVLSSKSNVQITLLNITRLSYYRKEAHTSIYKKQWMPLTSEQLANPLSYADCIHWCLPGVQDTWSELLFTKLFYP